MWWELRGTRVRRSVWAGILFATFPIVWWLRPLIIEDRIPICLFRIATTKPCPFCGLTRAFAHATHGEFGLAWESNPLWLLAVALIAADPSAINTVLPDYKKALEDRRVPRIRVASAIARACGGQAAPVVSILVEMLAEKDLGTTS